MRPMGRHVFFKGIKKLIDIMDSMMQSLIFQFDQNVATDKC